MLRSVRSTRPENLLQLRYIRVATIKKSSYYQGYQVVGDGAGMRLPYRFVTGTSGRIEFCSPSSPSAPRQGNPRQFTKSASFLTAIIPASRHIAWTSAPVVFSVRSAISSSDTPTSGSFAEWIFSISSRESRSGSGISITRSNRPGLKQRRVQHVDPVCRGHNPDIAAVVKPVHFSQELHQGLSGPLHCRKSRHSSSCCPRHRSRR